MPRMLAVVGLGYGDEGKGATVDYLAWKARAGGILVVRFNGGAQTAHNVVLPDGHHHTFSQIGSGAFQAAETLLSKDVIVNPRAMIVEWMSLRDKLPISRPTYVDSRCLVTTSFHIALNRARIYASGKNNSCGMGIGETRDFALRNGADALTVRDLGNACGYERPRKKLKYLQEVCRAEALKVLNTDRIPDAFEVLSADDDFINEVLWMYRHWYFHQISPIEQYGMKQLLERTTTTIFEGAQGVLLDEKHGEDGYNTWTNTTLENMDSLLKEAGFLPEAVLRLGVTRCYMTRHGDGPLKEEHDNPWPEPHNPDTGYSGRFRVGSLDFTKLRHSLEICPVDGLVVNHTDHSGASIGLIEKELGRPVLLTGSGPTRRDRQDMLHKLEKGELVCGR